MDSELVFGARISLCCCRTGRDGSGLNRGRQGRMTSVTWQSRNCRLIFMREEREATRVCLEEMIFWYPNVQTCTAGSVSSASYFYQK
jgi:hypothetical protein